MATCKPRAYKNIGGRSFLTFRDLMCFFGVQIGRMQNFGKVRSSEWGAGSRADPEGGAGTRAHLYYFTQQWQIQDF